MSAPNSRSCHSTCCGDVLISAKFWVCEDAIPEAKTSVTTTIRKRDATPFPYARASIQPSPKQIWSSLTHAYATARQAFLKRPEAHTDRGMNSIQHSLVFLGTRTKAQKVRHSVTLFSSRVYTAEVPSASGGGLFLFCEVNGL